MLLHKEIRIMILGLSSLFRTLYLSAILKPMATCSLRRQMGQKSSGLRSDSSRWLEPCMTQFNHWQWCIPNIWPISWVIVCQKNIWHKGYHVKTAVLKVFLSKVLIKQRNGRPLARPLKGSQYQNWVSVGANLAGSKEQGAGDGGSVITVKHRVVALLWLKPFLQSPSVTSAVEVVVIPGKAENTHSCRYSGEITVRM